MLVEPTDLLKELIFLAPIEEILFAVRLKKFYEQPKNIENDFTHK